MRQHATKIFHELLNAFGQYIQTSLANPCPGDELCKYFPFKCISFYIKSLWLCLLLSIHI
ncbi:unnamed protein product [Schistosoma curassoni]|uniref:Uncharacterized protein n=1 Tax=Schistosoma curassoni TaxID=6186 RepID=A0A183JR63_9TREM|nr:unnamed protein product [Schistosoma curassoni]